MASMRQAMSVYLTIMSTAFVLYETNLVTHLRPIMDLLRISTMSTLVARAPCSSKEVVSRQLRVILITLSIERSMLERLNRQLLLVSRAVEFRVYLDNSMSAMFVAGIVPTEVA